MFQVTSLHGEPVSPVCRWRNWERESELVLLLSPSTDASWRRAIFVEENLRLWWAWKLCSWFDILLQLCSILKARCCRTGISQLYEWASYDFRNRDRGTEVPVGGELDFLTITIFFLQSHSPENPLQAKLNHIILVPFFLGQVNMILNNIRKPSRKNT
jgi:hypothetical protein